MANIRRFLDLNTGHLPPELGTDGLADADGVIAHETDVGWLMWVPDNPDDPNLHNDGDEPPEIVQTIIRHARANDCDYVLFDRDGPVDDDLPTWDW